MAKFIHPKQYKSNIKQILNSLISIYIILFSMTSVSQARVFDLSREFFASYFLVTGGTWGVTQETFLHETPQDNFSYDKTWSNSLSGEFGFSYVMPYLGLRFGLEVFRPADLKEVSATGTGGAGTYTLASSITGYAPKVTAEFYFVRTNTTRAFVSVFGGTTSVTYRNEYTNVNFSGVNDHIFEAKGNGNLLGGTIGVENHMNDTTTIILETGYRSLKATDFTYSSITPTGSATFNTTPSVGDNVLLNDGSRRILDFTGYFISLGFRFYM